MECNCDNKFSNIQNKQIIECLIEACKKVDLKIIDKSKKFEDPISDQIADNLKANMCKAYYWLREFPIDDKKQQIKSSIPYSAFSTNLLTNYSQTSRVDIMCTDTQYPYIIQSNKVLSYHQGSQANSKACTLHCVIEVKQTFPYHNNIDLIALESHGYDLDWTRPKPKKYPCLDNKMWFVEYELWSDIKKRALTTNVSGLPFIWILAVANTKPGAPIQQPYYYRYKSSVERNYFAELFEYYFGEDNWCMFTNHCADITFYIGYADNLKKLHASLTQKSPYSDKLFDPNLSRTLNQVPYKGEAGIFQKYQYKLV